MDKKKVVIIDDEEDLCHLMKAYLADLNYDVFFANTLGSGLHLLKQVSPDILFIDNNLPDGLGWEKMDYLLNEYPCCKINLISAYKSSMVDGVARPACIRILEKPLSLSALRDYL